MNVFSGNIFVFIMLLICTNLEIGPSAVSLA